MNRFRITYNVHETNYMYFTESDFLQTLNVSTAYPITVIRDLALKLVGETLYDNVHLQSLEIKELVSVAQKIYVN